MTQKQLTVEEALAKINQPMPFADEAERGLISCILQDPQNRIQKCRISLQPSAFYQESTREVYEELLKMDEEGVKIDLVLVMQRLRDKGLLERVGGPAAISELFTFVPIPAHYDFYKKIVADKWRIRRSIHGRALGILHLFKHGAEHTDESPEQMINTCNQIAHGFDDSTEEVSTTATLSQCLMEHADRMEELTKRLEAGGEALIPTGFPTLDRNCGGIGMDEYWLITGPTKSGKSVLAGCIARHAARRGFKTKIYTNEVGRVTYAGRLLAGENGALDGKIERSGWKDRDQQNQYGKAIRSLQKTIGGNMLIDNSAGKYVEDVVADMRYEAERGLKLAVVDLIGKLRTRQKFGNREQELAHISLSLYEATKRFGVACLVLAQENKNGETRESQALAFDCEAWLKIGMIYPEKKKGMFGKEPEVQQPDRTRRNLIVELARGFASGDVISVSFDGGKFCIFELTNRNEP